jgi:hypothetical protein
MTLTSKISAAPGPAVISAMIVGAAIVALLMIIGTDREGKEGLRSGRQRIVHHYRGDGATARDVSNPPAGLQDQHAALDRHRVQVARLAAGEGSD